MTIVLFFPYRFYYSRNRKLFETDDEDILTASSRIRPRFFEAIASTTAQGSGSYLFVHLKAFSGFGLQNAINGASATTVYLHSSSCVCCCVSTTSITILETVCKILYLCRQTGLVQSFYIIIV